MAGGEDPGVDGMREEIRIRGGVGVDRRRWVAALISGTGPKKHAAHPIDAKKEQERNQRENGMKRISRGRGIRIWTGIPDIDRIEEDKKGRRGKVEGRHERRQPHPGTLHEKPCLVQ